VQSQSAKIKSDFSQSDCVKFSLFQIRIDVKNVQDGPHFDKHFLLSLPLYQIRVQKTKIAIYKSINWLFTTPRSAVNYWFIF